MENHKTDSFAIIDVCNWGSTGKISRGLYNYLQNKDIVLYTCHGRGRKTNSPFDYKVDYAFEVYTHYFIEKLTGQMCHGSRMATKRLIKFLRSHNVKGVYLMNLHGYYLNEKLFFDYLAKEDIKVVYLMVDEAPFLGNCTYANGCTLYCKSCEGCKLLKGWQKAIFGERSKAAYLIKDEGYKKINATFVGPEFVVLSAKTSPLLKGKCLEVVDEAIDVQVNKPQDTSLLKRELGIKEDQIVIGCVAPFSYPRKGVKFFVEAAKKLESDNRFVFVQVGYDIKDKSGLPKNYIPIEYVNSQDILIQYYSLADLFVFPSIQDTMPNACLEALSCGSPLLCFNTSGMPYMADDTVMTLVEPENVDQMVEIIIHTKKKDDETINRCRSYALKRFDNQKYFEKLSSIMSIMCNQ